MALLLAPYNNGMRIGQGFNSYTQQICIDDAVVLRADQKENIIDNNGLTVAELNERLRASLENPPEEKAQNLPEFIIDQVNAAKDDATGSELRSAKELQELIDLSEKYKNTKIYEFQERDGPSQIVIWTSKFVSKISDITEDMNISGSLSIKAGTIGGSGRGSFVDASKFQESDLNFYISVKVINQSINMKDSLEFQPLKSNMALEEGDFTKIFGDSFISGFLEGGELNGLVSMKVLNDAKKTDIAVAAKVALTVRAADISADAQVDVAKQNLHENTETTIQVSWSGGGHIKPRDQPWDIDTLTQAAARFPDLVARTPQRTYAILTKYDSLRSYHESKKDKKNFTPLQYENVQLYTNNLLDAYMDYKALYRTISDQIFELESGMRRFKTTAASDDSDGSDKDLSSPNEAEPDPNTTLTPTSKSISSPDDQIIDPSVYDETSFPGTLRGMDRARVEVRKMMSYIVSEVDVVTENPEMALDTKRKQPFQGVVTFRTRLPKTEYTNPANNVPLSMKKIPLDHAKAQDISLYPIEYGALEGDAKESVDLVLKNNPTATLNFRLDKVEGSHAGTIFNDLSVLRPEFMIRKVELQMFNDILGALRIRYTNGVSVVHGTFRSDIETQTLDLKVFRNELITSCTIQTGIPEKMKKDGAWVDYVPPKIDDDESDQTAGAPTTSSDKPSGAETEPSVPKGSPPVVISLQLYTNRGQTLEGDDPIVSRRNNTAQTKKMMFKEVNSMDYDALLDKGSIKGFWGWSYESQSGGPADMIYGLGPIWGCPPSN